MKNTLKQLFTGIIGFFLAAILFISDPPPESENALEETLVSAPEIIPTPKTEVETEQGSETEGPRDNKKSDDYLRELVHIVDEPTTKPGHTTWKAIYNLQCLVELGDEAIPGIAWILDRDYEVNYNWYQQPIDIFGVSHRLLPRNIKRVRRADVLFPNQDKPNLHYGFPLSLRLGLIEVLERIGGPYAEEALLKRVREAKKEIELAYAIKGLQVVAPDYHTVEITKRIQEILGIPETVYHTDELEIAARRYLVGINDALKKANIAAKKHEGPVNKGIPYKDLDDEAKNRLPVVMSSIFDTTRNLELDAPSELEYAIDRGLKFLELEHKEGEPSPSKRSPSQEIDLKSRHN